MLIIVFRVDQIGKLGRKTGTQRLSRCTPEKNIEHPAHFEMRPWCVLLLLDVISCKSTYF